METRVLELQKHTIILAVMLVHGFIVLVALVGSQQCANLPMAKAIRSIQQEFIEEYSGYSLRMVHMGRRQLGAIV